MHQSSAGPYHNDFARQIMVAASDMSLYLDRQGVITALLPGLGQPADPLWDGLVGKRWEETAAPDSQAKVKDLLADTLAGRPLRHRQINQRGQGGLAIPFRFAAVFDGHDHVVALGRDLSPSTAVHRQMVSAQQAADREFERIRQANTRYRILFNVSSEGVLVVDLATLRVVEANQAAATLLDEALSALSGRPVSSLFDAHTWPMVHNQVVAVQAGARSVGVPVNFAAQGRSLVVAVSLFRQGNAEYALVRLNPAANGVESGAVAQQRRTLAVVQALPDGFVVVDQNMVVLSANAAFCDLAQCPNENHVVGQPLEKWLGRPGVDINIILSNLRERGLVTQFSTVVRGEHGVVQPAVLSAVSALDARVPCMGFVIRAAAPSLPADPELVDMPRSQAQLRGLVGRVPLKEIVRESADLIEKLCIEAALRVSSDNRANAATLLGLSRQGLYSKLRRHGLGDLDPDPPQDS